MFSTFLVLFTPPPLRSPQFYIALKAAVLVGFFYGLDILSHINLLYAGSLSLGVVAAALADHEELYYRRYYAFFVLTVCFGFASFLVTLLFPYPILFFLWLFAATFVFVMAIAFGHKYGAITLSALIVAVYTMLGYHQFEDPWKQPVLLMCGALSYFFLSSLLQLFRPQHTLSYHNKHIFMQLAKYQLTKSRLFTPRVDLEKLSQSLAQQAANVSEAMATMRRQLMMHQGASKNSNLTAKYLDQFYKAQLIQERLTSFHLSEQIIQQELATTELPKLVQTAMVSVARRIGKQHQFSKSLKHSQTDIMNQSIDQLEQHVAILREEGEISTIGLNQIRYLIKNLRMLAELTSNHTPFPVDDFRFHPLGRVSIRDFISQCCSPSTELFRHAFRQALCMAVGYLLIQLSGGQDQHYWLLLTTLLVTKPNYSATKQRLQQRVGGTFFGIILATWVILMISSPILYALIATLCVFLFFWYFQSSYATSVATITVFVTMSLNALNGNSVDIITMRFASTMLGTVMVYMALRYLWPQWQQNRNKPIIYQAINRIREYQRQIFFQYKYRLVSEDEGFRLARFHAYQSESQLVVHWQAILAEPESKRSQEAALYQLTTRFHVYLCHLSTLAAHRSSAQNQAAAVLITEIGDLLTEALEQVADTIFQGGYQDSERLLLAKPERLLVATKISRQIKLLLPNLVGQDLLIAFQLQRLSDLIQDIHKIIIRQSVW